MIYTASTDTICAQSVFGGRRSRNGERTQGGEEPSVLSAGVSLLEDLLDVLLRILTLTDLLEGIVGDGALEALELEGVTGGHQVVVVDDLDEGLDLGALVLAGLGHAAGDARRVALDTGDERVAEGVRLVAVVDGLNDDHLEETRMSVFEVLPPRSYAATCSLVCRRPTSVPTQSDFLLFRIPVSAALKA